MMLNTVIITTEEYKLLVAKAMKLEMIANMVHEELMDNAKSPYDTRCISLGSVHLELLGLDAEVYDDAHKRWEESNADKQ